MKKNEIKSDLIHDKIITSANFITNNPKKFWIYVGSVFVLLLLIVIWSNNTESNNLLYNSYSSNNQNNYIDGKEDLAMLGFENILNDYSASESYNQAFIYSLSDAITNNQIDKIDTLINDNIFASKDNTMNFLYNYLLGNYYSTLKDYTKAQKYYNDALNYSDIEIHEINTKCALINLYIIEENLSTAQDIINSINLDDLSYQSKTKIDVLKSRLDYISK